MMIRSIAFVTAATAAAVLSACATYAPPPDSTTRVKFVGNHHYVNVDVGDSCSASTGVAKELWSSTYVPAGKRIWIEQGVDTRGLPIGFYCGLRLSFEPQENTTYIAEYQLTGMRCRMGLYRLDESGKRAPEPTVQTHRARTCLI